MSIISTNRRQFLGGAGALAAASALPCPAIAQAKPKVVVVGGGPGGATAAKYVRQGFRRRHRSDAGRAGASNSSPASIPISISAASATSSRSPTITARSAKYGVKLAHTTSAAAIDKDKKTVRLANGTTLPYDRLVHRARHRHQVRIPCPAIRKPRARACRMPGKPGPQTQLLKKQLDALKDGALIVMVAPPNPYRCPPGPYERVSMMAHVLKAKGHKKSKIVIIDPKETFSKQALFVEGWQKHYPGMVEWQDPKMHGGVKNVDPKTQDGEDRSRRIQGAARQRDPGADGRQDRARRRACQPDRLLPDQSGEHEVDDGRQYLHRRRRLHSGRHAEIGLLGQQPGQGRGDDDPRRTGEVRHLPGALHQHLLEPDRDRRHREGRRPLRPKDGKIAAVETFVSKTGESAELRKQTQQENMGWYSGITADIFA